MSVELFFFIVVAVMVGMFIMGRLR